MENSISKKLSLRQLFSSSLLIWSVVIVLNIFARYVDMVRRDQVFELAQSLFLFITSYSFWILLTPLVYRYLERRILEAHKGSLFTIFFVQALIIVPVFSFYDMAIFAWVEGIKWLGIYDLISKVPAFFILFDLMLYMVVFVGSLAFIYYRNSISQSLMTLELDKQKAELAQRLSDMKLTSLQAQLEPHFLFNSLNSISSLVRTNDKNDALTAIRRLSELLRYVVSASQKSLVLLTDEITFVQDYMALQCIRYGDRITIDWHFKGEQIDIECPPFLLHTLLENAIVHGVEVNSDCTNINVKIDINENLQIKITNTSPNTAKSKSLGIGLTNLQQRLNLAYKEHFQLEVCHDNGLFTVSVSIPIED